MKNLILGVTVGIGKDVVLPHPFSGVKSKYEVVQALARLAASAALQLQRVCNAKRKAYLHLLKTLTPGSTEKARRIARRR